MTQSPKRTAAFPGTFDPLTNGHLDVIRRASMLYDEVVVAVGDNPDKRSLVPQDQRAEMIRQVIGHLNNVRVETYTGLTINFVKKLGVGVIVRGIRDSMDLQAEAQMAEINRCAGGVETVFIPTAAANAFLSSALVRQILAGGGDVSAMVPPEILPLLKKYSDS
ncbi:MAG: pantetheine-phosphate adenylyltransferase [Planctomycetota bacterium]|jgi:pantetheine-phosphate adenylyltransferase